MASAWRSSVWASGEPKQSASRTAAQNLSSEGDPTRPASSSSASDLLFTPTRHRLMAPQTSRDSGPCLRSQYSSSDASKESPAESPRARMSRSSGISFSQTAARREVLSRSMALRTAGERARPTNAWRIPDKGPEASPLPRPPPADSSASEPPSVAPAAPPGAATPVPPGTAPPPSPGAADLLPPTIPPNNPDEPALPAPRLPARHPVCRDPPGPPPSSSR